MTKNNDANNALVLYNLLRQEIGAIEMALESVRLYAKGEGRYDKKVQEALAQIEDRLKELNDRVDRTWRVHALSKGEK